MHLGTRDARLLARAVSKRWNIPDEVWDGVVPKLWEIGSGTTHRLSAGTQVQALRAIMDAGSHNLEAAKVDDAEGAESTARLTIILPSNDRDRRDPDAELEAARAAILAGLDPNTGAAPGPAPEAPGVPSASSAGPSAGPPTPELQEGLPPEASPPADAVGTDAVGSARAGGALDISVIIRNACRPGGAVVRKGATP